MAITRLISIYNYIAYTKDMFNISPSIADNYYINTIGNGLELIGTYDQLVMKEAIVTIENYRGEMPCDYYALHELSSYSPNQDNTNGIYSTVLNQDFTVYRTRISELRNLIDTETNTQLIVQYSKELADLEVALIESQGSKFDNSHYLNRDQNILFNNDHLVGDISRNSHYQTDFKLEHNLITVGYKDGFVKVIYLAIPTDDEGYPKVPDNSSFREALAWFVAYHLSLGGKLPNKQLDSESCFRKWQFYCRQARGEGYSPDINSMQRMVNNHNKMIKDNNLYYQRFRDLGKRSITTNY